MRGARVTIICLFFIHAVAAVTRAQTRPSIALPSQVELHEMYQEARYQEVIRQVVRILPIKGEAAGQWDRFELLRLKAESHLRLGDAALAAKAFDEAAGAASEPTQAAICRSTASLIRRSKRDGYVAKTGALAGEAIAIVDADSRHLALKALYDDERSAAAKPIAAIAQAEELDRLLAGLEMILTLRDFELAASGGDLDSQMALEPIANQLESLLKQQIKKRSARAEKLDKAANTRKKMGSHYRKRGLAKDEIAELRNAADDCRRFEQAAQRFAAVIAPESKQQPFHDLQRDAQQLAKRIDAILAADYGGLYDRN